MKYLWTMVELSLVSNIHFPGECMAPIFQPIQENCPRISDYLQSNVVTHHVAAIPSEASPGKTTCCSRKGKEVHLPPPQRKPEPTLAFPRLSYQGFTRVLERFLIKEFKMMTISNVIRTAMAEMAVLLFRNFLIALAGLYPCFQ